MISNKISNHILLGFILVVLIAIALSAVAFSFHLKAVEIRNVTKMLDAAIETAWSQFEAKPLQLQTVLKEASREQVLKDAIRQKDYQALKELIRNWEEVYPNCDYFVIVDTDGKVLCRDSANRGDTWHLKSLARKGLASKETIVSTELVPADVLKNESKQLAEKAVVEITEPTNEHGQGGSLFKDALMTVVVVPVIEDNKAIGVISGGFLLNHDEWIAREYTSRIPNTYLSIGVKGVRISSNIKTDDFARPMGSVQENELVETTSAGKRYRGKLLVKDRPALIVADPIISYGGQVVGNIGVGAPINMFEEFAGSIKTILTICLLIFVVSVFLSERASNVITQPIYELKELAKKVASNNIEPEVIQWEDSKAPVEINELANNMIEMARALKQKEIEAQTYAQDLTNEKELLEVKIHDRTRQLAQLVAELKTANKYKSQFLANMSHELLTPLNSIIGFAKLLEDQTAGPLNEKQLDYTATIVLSADHLLELINDILDLVKIDQGKSKLIPEYISLEEVVNSMVLLLGPQAEEKGLTMEVKLEENLPSPYWDKKKTKQILANLLTNAIKFTPEGGSILVSAQNIGDKIKIAVSDTGIGIKPEDLEKVFLAFEQAEASYTRRYKGAGLGLAITKNLVEIHKGKIWLENNAQGGTDAIAVLPINPFDKNGGDRQ
ncbi:MAG TPA: ATP-binding protein [Bacillota bacterium]|mgnify:FL=1|nr:ATP-binding protein [Bacillota bacterium]